MPSVKIELRKGETPEQAEDLLFKAFEAQRNGDTHGEEFNDPAMADLLNRVLKINEEQYALMLQEINEALEQEYRNGNE